MYTCIYIYMCTMYAIYYVLCFIYISKKIKGQNYKNRYTHYYIHIEFAVHLWTAPVLQLPMSRWPWPWGGWA